MASGKITKRSVDTIMATERDAYLWDTALSGFGLKVTPTGRKVYLVQYRTGGRTRRVTIGRHGDKLTPEMARRSAKKLLGQVAHGEDPAAARDLERDQWTVRQAAQAFLEQHAEAKRRPTTAREYRRVLDLHVLPALGSRAVDRVTGADMTRLHHKMASRPYQANRILAVCSKLFSWCIQQGVRQRQNGNPCQGLERFTETARERLLSADELARLGNALTAAEADGSASAPAIAAIRLLLLTGARRDEILTLKWSYIDLSRGVARLPDSKTGAKTIVLPPPALEVLAGIIRVEGNPFVIVGAKPGARLINLAKTWRRIRAAAGLPDLRLHDLRHAFASQAAASGMSLPLIGALLGHSQPATTARYAHFSSDPLRAAADKIAAHFVASMAGRSAEVVAISDSKATNDDAG